MTGESLDNSDQKCRSALQPEVGWQSMPTDDTFENRSRRIVLLVEDNLMNMELASDLLEGAGFQVLKTGRAEEGIALAVAQQPDLILMDIALPGMDGLEATRRLKLDARTAWIPVVCLTASAMRGDDNKARLAGCCGYIAKPIDTRRFIKTVTGFMGKERSPGHGTA